MSKNESKESPLFVEYETNNVLFFISICKTEHYMGFLLPKNNIFAHN